MNCVCIQYLNMHTYTLYDMIWYDVINIIHTHIYIYTSCRYTASTYWFRTCSFKLFIACMRGYQWWSNNLHNLSHNLECEKMCAQMGWSFWKKRMPTSQQSSICFAKGTLSLQSTIDTWYWKRCMGSCSKYSPRTFKHWADKICVLGRGDVLLSGSLDVWSENVFRM